MKKGVDTNAELQELRRIPANKKCFDCNQAGTTYALPELGIFLCSICGGIHREFNHRVKGLSTCNFSEIEVNKLKNLGNERAQGIWMAKHDSRSFPIPDVKDSKRLKDFLRVKYLDKRFYESKDNGVSKDLGREEKKVEKKEEVKVVKKGSTNFNLIDDDYIGAGGVEEKVNGALPTPVQNSFPTFSAFGFGVSNGGVEGIGNNTSNAIKNVPFNIPPSVPSNMPSNIPFGISSNTPFNIPSNAPSNTPYNAPSNVSFNPPSSFTQNSSLYAFTNQSLNSEISKPTVNPIINNSPIPLTTPTQFNPFDLPNPFNSVPTPSPQPPPSTANPHIFDAFNLFPTNPNSSSSAPQAAFTQPNPTPQQPFNLFPNSIPIQSAPNTFVQFPQTSYSQAPYHNPSPYIAYPGPTTNNQNIGYDTYKTLNPQIKNNGNVTSGLSGFSKSSDPFEQLMEEQLEKGLSNSNNPYTSPAQNQLVQKYNMTVESYQRSYGMPFPYSFHEWKNMNPGNPAPEVKQNRENPFDLYG